MDIHKINREMSYIKTKEYIEEYVKNGGDLNSSDICDDNLISVICYNYLNEHGLFSYEKYNDEINMTLNKNRETDIELHKRQSGIVIFLEWLNKNGFDYKNDCYKYLNNTKLDRFESPIIIASCIGHDMYLMEYLVNNGYKELLYEPIDAEDNNCNVIDYIWEEIDLCSEDYRYLLEEHKDEEIFFYKNDARLLRYLIYLGCQKRDGYIIKVNTDLSISFPGPVMLY